MSLAEPTSAQKRMFKALSSVVAFVDLFGINAQSAITLALHIS